MRERAEEDALAGAGSASGSRVPARSRGSIAAVPVLMPAATAIILGGLATAYGTLDGGDHPTVSIGGAMVLAAAGTLWALVLIDQQAAPRLAATSPVLLVLTWASVQAGLVHFAVVPQHFEEFWLYGLFFIVVGLAQIASVYLVIKLPLRPVLVVIALGNLAVAVVWAVTRTYGAVVGPDATKPARAGFGDIVSSVLEVVVSVAALMLVARPDRMRRSEPQQSRESLNTVIAFGVTLLSILALYSTVRGRPFVTHVG